MARPYRMKQRAAKVEETRRRITEAAIQLHGTVGPARTTISAVAERAGVERLTVYRHFPDEHALFEACTSHWLAANPFPDPAGWARIDDPRKRLEHALGELYAWYEQTEGMMTGFFRDAPFVPALAGRIAQWEAYMEEARRVLARGWGARGRRRALLEAALGHALAFETWASLTKNGLDGKDAIRLMGSLVASTLEPPPRSG